jgi:thiosulfate/3-mercaptopyruvate sulfurtransferase
MLTSLSIRQAVVGAAAGLAAIALLGTAGSLAAETDSPWVVDAATAKELIAQGAIVLDARGAELKQATPITGAQEVVWQDFTHAELPIRGQLLEDDALLTEKLRSLGISADIPVIAVADSTQGWGEDGRIVWTLRTLGHDKTYLVDGGVTALTEGGAPEIRTPQLPGTFTVQRVADYEIKKEELARALGSPNLVILDTREPREYAGATPYGESRGGHVPGARHIFYKDLVNEAGHILADDELKARLAELGVGEDTEVVSYCTGGIRSGFVTAVLNNAGVKARNYAGSMWEWSASPATEYPLVTQ